MRLLPMMLLATVVGIALVYAPLLTTGTTPNFVKQFATEPTAGDNMTGFWVMNTNDTGKSVGEGRIESFESEVLKIEPTSPYGVLLGLSVVAILGLLVAITSYVIVRRGFIWI